MKAIYIIVGILILLLILSFIGHIVIQQNYENDTKKILRNIRNNPYTYYTTHVIGECSLSKFGCCPNGQVSKLNELGSNCFSSTDSCANNSYCQRNKLIVKVSIF